MTYLGEKACHHSDTGSPTLGHLGVEEVRQVR